MQIDVLENRESMQITLKQIMEHVVSKRMNVGDAGVLLRAIQIAGSTWKREKDKEKAQPNRKRPIMRATRVGVNAEQSRG